MIDIRLSDCRLINGHIRIRIIGKGKKERYIYIPTELYQAIRHQYKGKTWLFESRTGKQLHRKNVALQIGKAAKRVGVTSFHPHMLRHSRATDMLLNKDISLKAVSKFLGHASVATTAQMYIHDEVDYHYLFSKDSI
jgi:integrase/recombinase XerD